MPTTYRKADDEVTDLLAWVMGQFHQDLDEAKVHVGVLVAENPNGDAVKHGGYPAFACIRLVSARDRVAKVYDAELLLDGGKWDDLRPTQRVALLDHELSHLRLKKSWRTPVLDANEEPTGETTLHWEEDDEGRPGLKLVKGDWSVGDGFAAVVARHGPDAIEYASIALARGHAERARQQGERERERPPEAATP